MGTDASGSRDFGICFLDAEGALVQSVLVTAETLIGATENAEEIARSTNAAHFVITAVPDVSDAGGMSVAQGIAGLFAPMWHTLIDGVHLRGPQRDSGLAKSSSNLLLDPLGPLS